jgi:hypothetical protein
VDLPCAGGTKRSGGGAEGGAGGGDVVDHEHRGGAGTATREGRVGPALLFFSFGTWAITIPEKLDVGVLNLIAHFKVSPTTSANTVLPTLTGEQQEVINISNITIALFIMNLAFISFVWLHFRFAGGGTTFLALLFLNPFFLF